MAKLTAQFDYTDSEYLALLREARVFASQNKSYTIGNKTFTRQDLDDLTAEIEKVERRISAASRRPMVAFGQHARRT